MSDSGFLSVPSLLGNAFAGPMGAVAGQQAQKQIIEPAAVAKKAEDEARRKQDEEFQKTLDAFYGKIKDEPQQETEVRQAARKRQMSASAGSGRRSTILTGPLGVVGGEQTPRKQLLGE